MVICFFFTSRRKSQGSDRSCLSNYHLWLCPHPEKTHERILKTQCSHRNLPVFHSSGRTKRLDLKSPCFPAPSSLILENKEPHSLYALLQLSKVHPSLCFRWAQNDISLLSSHLLFLEKERKKDGNKRVCCVLLCWRWEVSPPIKRR